jgi:hypothetical protein
VRLTRFQSICRAPQFLTEEFLSAEGFTDTMQYIGPSIMQVESIEEIHLFSWPAFKLAASNCSEPNRYIPSSTSRTKRYPGRKSRAAPPTRSSPA